MKKINIYHYDSTDKRTELSRKIEENVNNCRSIQAQKEALKDKIGEDVLLLMSMACICYWSEAEHWDERNQYAVCSSKKIAEKFPSILTDDYSETILRNAYAFTIYAHRYLQNEFFKVALEMLKDTQFKGIYQWYTEQEFVFYHEDLIPYNEYKSLTGFKSWR